MTEILKGYHCNYQNLWNGCILASIAHAIMVTEYPDFFYEHSWDDNNYNVQDGQGTRGTISFKDNFFIVDLIVIIAASQNLIYSLEKLQRP
ncbi:hypothetical protein [Peribacillus muralis]|uniref:hypothetical protein n=1 Tax=Peribacillus muralis TaxID=264697 RepID=UPI0009F2F0EE|nr:hypothetical protein [Peribacillus muralis]